MAHKLFSTILTLAGLVTLPAFSQDTAEDHPDQDLLSFRNGDFLHGKFVGLTGGTTLQWQHPDVPETIDFETTKLRRIALNGGHAQSRLQSHSYLRMSNGDRLPGEIISLDGEFIRLATPFAGECSIHRSAVSHLAPVPYGGKVYYQGPYSEDRWTLLLPDKKENPDEHEKPPPEPEVPADEEAPAAEAEVETEAEKPWIFSGAAWYSKGTVPLALDAQLPETALISFDLAWKNRLNAVVAFHATLKVPEVEEAKEEEEEVEDPKKVPKPQIIRRIAHNRGSGSSAFPQIYGESYVLTLYSNYAQLYRCSFGKDGTSRIERLTSSSTNIRLSDTGAATIELRCDQEDARISLFVDGHFVTHWIDPEGYAGTGTNLAFANQDQQGRLRISNVVAASWNGMVDSAVSMESKDRDVVLLTNGTDRFSGSVTGISNGELALKGTFAEMTIPLEDIEEVRFASDNVNEIDDPSENALRLHLQPVGRITLEPGKTSDHRLNGKLGNGDPITIDLNHVDLMEFVFGDSALDAWDDDF